MRIAILADIHGNLAALEAVAGDIHRRGADRIVNLGDSLSGPLLPLETAQFLMSTNWLHLAGNQERQLLSDSPEQWSLSDRYTHGQLTGQELSWLASLPATAHLDPTIFLCHGTPASDLEYFLETVEPTHVRLATPTEIDRRLGKVDAELIACGHTHLPRAIRASTGQLIINPGSVGLPAYDDSHPYPHVMATGSPDARYALVERHKDGWHAALIAVPYPHRTMAELARQRQRHDWANALLTGYGE